MYTERELSAKKLWHQKKNSMLVVIVLAISILFLLALHIFTDSAKVTRKNLMDSLYGIWDVAIVADGGVVPAEREGFTLIGTAELSGIILAPNGGWAGPVGVVSDGIREQIPLLEGEWPDGENEIVMEAKVLNNLGLTYELGQEIKVSVQAVEERSHRDFFEESEITEEWEEPIVTEQTFVLTGVIQQYSGIWNVPTNQMPGAILWEEAHEGINRTYFYQVDGWEKEDVKNIAEGMIRIKEYRENETYEWVAGEVRENPADRYLETVVTQMDQFVGMICLMTVIAIAAVYLMEMENHHKQTILFMQIGANRRFLIIQGLWESGILVLLALPLGVLGGGFVSWLLLRIYRQVDVAETIVSIPWGKCAASLLLLFGLVMGERLLLLIWSLCKKDIGKVSEKKQTIYGRVGKKVVLALLAAAGMFCGSYLYGETISPIHTIDFMGDWYSYHVSKSGSWEEEFVWQMEEIPGITETVTMRNVAVCLYPEELEENEFQRMMKEYTEGDFYFDVPPGKLLGEDEGRTRDSMIRLLAVRNEDWEWLFSYLPEVDREKVLDGKQVIAYFQEVSEESVEIPIRTEAGLRKEEIRKEELYPEGQVDLFRYEVTLDAENNLAVKKMEKVSAEVGGYLYLPYEEDFTGSIARGEPLLLCSDSFFDQIYSLSDQEVFSSVYAKTNREASFLGTDKQVAELSYEYGMSLESNRESNDAIRNSQMQNLLMLLFAGGCILIILLVLFWNLCFLKLCREERSRKIFYAIGMSRRQMLWRNVRELSGILGIGWLISQAMFGFRMWGVFDSVPYETWNWLHYMAVQVVLLIVFWLVGFATIYKEGRREAEWKS